nr:hypothetical protein [Tanacetum cinerariifolium]
QGHLHRPKACQALLFLGLVFVERLVKLAGQRVEVGRGGRLRVEGLGVGQVVGEADEARRQLVGRDSLANSPAVIWLLGLVLGPAGPGAAGGHHRDCGGRQGAAPGRHRRRHHRHQPQGAFGLAPAAHHPAHARGLPAGFSAGHRPHRPRRGPAAPAAKPRPPKRQLPAAQRNSRENKKPAAR